MERCQIVSEQLLECFAIALGEEPDYFVRVGALLLGSSTAAVWRAPGKQLTWVHVHADAQPPAGRLPADLPADALLQRCGLQHLTSPRSSLRGRTHAHAACLPACSQLPSTQQLPNDAQLRVGMALMTDTACLPCSGGQAVPGGLPPRRQPLRL